MLKSTYNYWIRVAEWRESESETELESIVERTKENERQWFLRLRKKARMVEWVEREEECVADDSICVVRSERIRPSTSAFSCENLNTQMFLIESCLDALTQSNSISRGLTCRTAEDKSIELKEISANIHWCELPLVNLEIYDTYEVEVKNTFGFEQSSVVLSCEISPPSASSYVQIIGWLEKVNKQLIQLDLRKFDRSVPPTRSDDDRSQFLLVFRTKDTI